MPTKTSRERIDAAIGLWEARHGKRMTYTELARRAGITLISLNRLMSGDIVTPDLRKLDAIAKVLECTADSFFQTYKTTTNVGRLATEVDYKNITLELEKDAHRRFVARYKGWIIWRQHPDKADVVLLKPGASSDNPKPDDIQILRGVDAEEWRRQNPKDEGIAKKR